MYFKDALKLVHKLEERYGSMSAVDFRDPDYIEMRYIIMSGERPECTKDEMFLSLVQEFSHAFFVKSWEVKGLIENVLYNIRL